MMMNSMVKIRLHQAQVMDHTILSPSTPQGCTFIPHFSVHWSPLTYKYQLSLSLSLPLFVFF